MSPDSQESKNKKAMLVAMGLAMEFLGLSAGGILVGQYVGGHFNYGMIGATLGFIVGAGAWVWRMVRTKRHIL